MSFLYIREYQNASRQGIPDQSVPAGHEDSNVIDQPPVAISGATAQSNAFAATTRFVRLHTDSICSISPFGVNPIATTANARMAANQTEFFGVIPGWKVAVIANV